MANKKKKPIIWVERNLFGSDAYRDITRLSPTSCIVLGLLWERRQMKQVKLLGKTGKRKPSWITKNNGQIELPYDYVERKYNIPQTTYSRALQVLEGVGFITIDKVPGKHGMKNLFGFSDKWKQYQLGQFQWPEKQKRKPINGGFRKGNKHGRKFGSKTETTAVDES